MPEFLKGSAGVAGLNVAAICARAQSAQKAENLAKENNIPKVYLDRTEFLADKSIDAVYVALPNHLHAEASIETLNAGKHVIVEKPFASNKEQAEEMFVAAEKNGCYLFEAIACIYLPAVQKAMELLSEAGDIKIVQTNYSQYSRRYERFKNGELPPVFDVNMSGGALMDLGVYNVHFANTLFGKPLSVQYTANIERGIDTSGTIILRYPNHICVMTAAKDCAAPCSVAVQGDKACIYSKDPANTILSLELRRTGGETETFDYSDGKDRMTYELEVFTNMILHKDDKAYKAAKEKTLAVMQVLDEGRTQVGIPIKVQ